MRPKRPLPTLPFVDMPLRRDPNIAAAIIAACVTRGHCTSLGWSRFDVRITQTVIPHAGEILVGNGADVNRLFGRTPHVMSREIS